MTVCLDFSKRISSASPAATSTKVPAFGSSQIFIVLSWLPLTNHVGCLPCEAKAFLFFGIFLGKDNADIADVCPFKQQTLRHVSLDQIRMDWSFPPVAIH